MNIPPIPDVQNNVENANKFFLVTRLIHFALIMGVVMFGVVAFSVSAKQMSYVPDFHNPIILIVILVCLGNIGASFFVAPIYRKVVPAPTTPSSAMKQYQAMSMVRWAIVEGGALFCGVAMIVTRNILPVIIMILTAAFLAYCYPSQKEFVRFTESP